MINTSKGWSTRHQVYHVSRNVWPIVPYSSIPKVQYSTIHLRHMTKGGMPHHPSRTHGHRWDAPPTFQDTCSKIGMAHHLSKTHEHRWNVPPSIQDTWVTDEMFHQLSRHMYTVGMFQQPPRHSQRWDAPLYVQDTFPKLDTPTIHPEHISKIPVVISGL